MPRKIYLNKNYLDIFISYYILIFSIFYLLIYFHSSFNPSSSNDSIF